MSKYTTGEMAKLCNVWVRTVQYYDTRGLLEEERPESEIALLLEEQERMLRNEIAQKQERAERILEVKRALNKLSQVSVESLGDLRGIIIPRYPEAQ